MAKDTISLLPQGTLIADRFQVSHALGRGGMATVYEAQDRHLRQRVAIKVLAPAFAENPGAIERFLREARAVVCLRNQHVVRVLDAGTMTVGAPYLAMEYLDGQSLAAVLAKQGRLAATVVVDYALQALEALAEAHRAGIVHRDLKPDNLMVVTGEDALPQIKIIDFGISKLIGPEFTVKNLTLESSFLGSPAYASPEQLRDAGKVDARTDIWSLGVVMYELLCGRTPFEGRGPAAMMTAICSAKPARVDEYAPDVPEGLANVVMRCLEKEPDRRYASAGHLATALAGFALDVRSRLSIDRIVRVQSNAPPPPSATPLDTVATPSLLPAWSTSTELAPARGARYRRAAWVAASLAGLAALVTTLLLLRREPTRGAAAPRNVAAAPALSVDAPVPLRTVVPLPDVSVVGSRRLPLRPPARDAAEAPSSPPQAGRSIPALNVGPGRRPLDTENPFKR